MSWTGSSQCFLRVAALCYPSAKDLGEHLSRLVTDANSLKFRLEPLQDMLVPVCHLTQLKVLISKASGQGGFPLPIAAPDGYSASTVPQLGVVPAVFPG